MPKQVWRPRHGRPLMEKRAPSRIERAALCVVNKVPKVFLYGPVVIVIGVLIPFSGHRELLFRSAGMALLALWLAGDLWWWLLKNGSVWRFVIGWTGTQVLVRRPGDFVSSVSLSTARKFSADFADSGAGDSNAAFIIAGTP